MFSGKTEELLRRIRRAEIARKQVQLFKPSLDDRHGLFAITSHNGVSRDDVVVVESAMEILYKRRKDTDVIAIDEVQFFDDAIVDVCDQLAEEEVCVIVAGLDQDFRGKPFGPIPKLLAIAERVDKLDAICVVCGAAAAMSQRLIGGEPAPYDDEIVLVDGSDRYEARCRKCHTVPGKPQLAVLQSRMVGTGG
jgi:thymidine kinase